MYNNILDLLENSCKNYPEKVAFGDVERDITFRELVASKCAYGASPFHQSGLGYQLHEMLGTLASRSPAQP